MEGGNQNPIILEGLANAYQKIYAQFDNAQQQVTGLRNEFAATRNELAETQGNLLAARSTSTCVLNQRSLNPLQEKGLCIVG